MTENTYMQKWAEGFNDQCELNGLDVFELIKSAEGMEELQKLYAQGKDLVGGIYNKGKQWWGGLSTPAKWGIGAGAAAAILPRLFKSDKDDDGIGGMLMRGLPAGAAAYFGSKYLPSLLEANQQQDIGQATKPISGSDRLNRAAMYRALGYPGTDVMNQLDTPKGYQAGDILSDRQKVDYFNAAKGGIPVGAVAGTKAAPYSDKMDPVNTEKGWLHYL